MIDLNAIKAAAAGALKHGETIGETEWYSVDENMSIFAPSPDLTYIATMSPATAKELAELAERLQSELTAAHEQLGYNAKPNDSQEWARISGAVAHQLIERHADDWREAGDMMEAFAASRAAARPAVVLPTGWRARLAELRDNTETFGRYSQETARVAIECCMNAMEELEDEQQAPADAGQASKEQFLAQAVEQLAEIESKRDARLAKLGIDAGQAQALTVEMIVRDVAELDYSSDTTVDRMEVNTEDLRTILWRHLERRPVFRNDGQEPDWKAYQDAESGFITGTGTTPPKATWTTDGDGKRVLAAPPAPAAQPEKSPHDVCRAIERNLRDEVLRLHEVIAAQPEQQPVALEQVPVELRRIGELLRTQDNRYTDQPMFIVQQKRLYVTEEGYNDSRIEWCQSGGDYIEASPLRARRLESLYQRTGEKPEGWDRLAVHEVWEFVTACFTEQGCKDYLARDGHNLKEPRIYADGSYRNEEFRTVRNWLMSLEVIRDAAPVPAAAPGPLQGWKLVPVEPTSEMLKAGINAYRGFMLDAYRSMLAAAPVGGKDE